jgi:hypothetical protein
MEGVFGDLQGVLRKPAEILTGFWPCFCSHGPDKADLSIFRQNRQGEA